MAVAVEGARMVAVPKVTSQLDYALALELGCCPQMNCTGTTVIVVCQQKQATRLEWLMILSTAKLWGWHDATLNTRRRVWIACAVCQQVAYDHEYEQTMTLMIQ